MILPNYDQHYSCFYIMGKVLTTLTQNEGCPLFLIILFPNLTGSPGLKIPRRSHGSGKKTTSGNQSKRSPCESGGAIGWVFFQNFYVVFQMLRILSEMFRFFQNTLFSTGCTKFLRFSKNFLVTLQNPYVFSKILS